MDETWLYDYDPKTQQQSMEWRHNGSLRAKKFREQESSEKFLASIFWDQDSILCTDCLTKGPLIKAKYYSSLLVQF
jgi:5-methylcytosine-specific restriction endonuclease McrA